MESTVSVSKGVFLFPNGFEKLKKNKRKSNHNLLFQSLYIREPWYVTYKRHWDIIEDKIKELHHKTYNTLLVDIVSYIKSFCEDNEWIELEGTVPTATLLTGANQPDHVSQLMALNDKIREEVTPHVAMVNSEDAPTVKHLVENAVWQLIYGQQILDNLDDEDSSEDVTKHTKKKIKKNKCTMKALDNWYQNQYVNCSPKKKRHVSKRILVIIIPDFESFNCNVLQDFVMIVSSHVSSVPVVFVFGVATSASALHKSFPYHVSSKLLIKVFHSHSSAVYLNKVFEDIFLTHTSPFHLSGKIFELLTDVFLFYDFSVSGLIQSIKYCMMNHYYGDNVKSLCCSRDKVEEIVMNLHSEDIENIRHLLSFRPFVEAQDCQTKIGLFEDDTTFKEILCREIIKFHDYLYSFYVCVRLLLAFVKDLPKNMLGKTIREIYSKCVAGCIVDSQAFKECMQLLNFQSQVKLTESIKSALKVLNTALQIVSPIKPFRSTPTKNGLNNISVKDDLGENFVKSVRLHLLMFLRQIENANTEATVLADTATEIDNNVENVGNRYKLKERLLKAAKVDKIQSEYEMIRARFVSYLEEVCSAGLRPPHTRPFYEIFFFSDASSVKKQIVGSPRGAIHTALSNPGHYLQCSCCAGEGAATQPAVCVAHTLLRECGKHVNLYDWLQAFAAVLRPDAPDAPDQHDQHDGCDPDDAVIHLQFTQAVAELQFLGFIKSSKRKTDHVMRLTW